MVARPMPTRSVASVSRRPSAAERLFTTWRLSLTHLFTRTKRLASARSAALASTARSTAGHAREAIRTAESDVRALTHDAIESTTESASATADSLGWLYGGWRRAVTRAVRTLRRLHLRRRLTASGETVTALSSDTMRFVRAPSTFGTIEPARADRVARLGIRALVAGVTLGLGLGLMTGLGPGTSVSRAVGVVLWACARLAILLALAPRRARMRVIVIAAWSASLLPYLAGVTEGLRILALVASAYLCLGALQGSGVSGRDSRTMTAWAFGGQAGVTALGWALRGVVALLTTL